MKLQTIKTRMPNLLACLVVLLATGPAQPALAVEPWSDALPVGSQIPAIDAVDQHGQSHNFADLTGGAGLLLFFNRSTSW